MSTSALHQVILTSIYLFSHAGLPWDRADPNISDYIPFLSCCFSAISCIIGVISGLIAFSKLCTKV